MHRSSEFRSVVRDGRRVHSRTVVVHHLTGRAAPTDAPHVGLVVGRQLGSSVTRHRVSRRLRAQLATRLEVLPAGSGTVVRALPNAAAATSAGLGADLDAAFARVLAR